MPCSRLSVWDVVSDLERLSARFSFNDFPDFLVKPWRGDLSDNVGPLIRGPGWSRSFGLYAHCRGLSAPAT